jgi:hypothetical protein
MLTRVQIIRAIIPRRNFTCEFALSYEYCHVMSCDQRLKLILLFYSVNKWEIAVLEMLMVNGIPL